MTRATRNDLYTEHIVSKYLTRMRTESKADAVRRGLWYNPTNDQLAQLESVHEEMKVRRETKRAMLRIHVSCQNLMRPTFERFVQTQLHTIAAAMGIPRSEIIKGIRWTNLHETESCYPPQRSEAHFVLKKE